MSVIIYLRCHVLCVNLLITLLLILLLHFDHLSHVHHDMNLLFVESWQWLIHGAFLSSLQWQPVGIILFS
uniref:Uncharacterized protein n=1 Tax=Aegilops tauschii subsp. strangulata TaxID=200361 RepID=A0A452Z8U2_AEGTS